MRTFNAKSITENRIELNNSTDLEELYATIESEENFIIKWMEGKLIHSELVIANNLISKIKTGDFKLSAVREQK